MDTEQLNAFVMVAKHGSFSRAAKTLYLSQSAVSKRIATLEQSLKTTLFDRIGHRIELTEAGQLLLPRAHNILREILDSRTIIQNLNHQIGGRLRLGTSHHIGLHRLPPVLRSFTRQFEQVSLEIDFLDSEQACFAIEKGHLELAIVTLPLKPSPMLNTTPVWTDILKPVVSHAHELSNHTEVTLKQLSEFNAILPAKGTFTRTVLENAMQQRHITLKSSLSTNYLETIKMMVTVGLGWTILPVSMHDKELKVLKTPQLKLKRQLGIVTHIDRTLSNATQAFIDLLLHKFSSDTHL
ncbi:Transcriptional regulator, LysR family [hydrothermal vent metagenome]|uniref:Transcriptional regulator, LysR family n=1 Tax=hydrothermal vent metagenome TaxID=652676 RepID=A0A3B0XQP9_9ZZZZ